MVFNIKMYCSVHNVYAILRSVALVNVVGMGEKRICLLIGLFQISGEIPTTTGCRSI